MRVRRDPHGTREAILEAALQLLARDGEQGISVAGVAQRAGINRGTAYQHFQTREQLVRAATDWVSDRLFRSVFGAPELHDGSPSPEIDPEQTSERLARFAMDHPDLGRAWLFGLLRSDDPSADAFFRQYLANFSAYARSPSAVEGVDTEVMAFLSLSATFLWPVWVRVGERSGPEKLSLSSRFARELLRLSLHGNWRAGRFQRLNLGADKNGAAADA